MESIELCNRWTPHSSVSQGPGGRVGVVCGGAQTPHQEGGGGGGGELALLLVFPITSSSSCLCPSDALIFMPSCLSLSLSTFQLPNKNKLKYFLLFFSLFLCYLLSPSFQVSLSLLSLHPFSL